MNIFRNVSKTRRFQKAHQLISKKLLNEQWENTILESNMKNMLLKENQKLFQLRTLGKKRRKEKSFLEIIQILKLEW